MNGEPQRIFLGKTRFLYETNILLVPSHFRGDEQVDVDAARIVEVDAVAELRKGLRHASRAAPEIVQRCSEEFPIPALKRNVVELVAIGRVLHTQDSVVVRTLVVVRRARISGPAQEVPRQLL